MKKIFLLVALSIFGLSVFAQNRQTKKQGAIVFKSIVFDFGKIPHESNGNAEFMFKNISKTSVEISEAKPSCDCASVDYTKGEIKKKGKGKIFVTYDTKNIGKFNKTISVSIKNQENPILLEIKGEVLQPNN